MPGGRGGTEEWPVSQVTGGWSCQRPSDVVRGVASAAEQPLGRPLAV